MFSLSSLFGASSEAVVVVNVIDGFLCVFSGVVSSFEDGVFSFVDGSSLDLEEAIVSFNISISLYKNRESYSIGFASSIVNL